MQFGIEKCAVLSMYRGNLREIPGIALPDDTSIKGLKEGDNYKYLGVLQADKVTSNRMKEMVANEYNRRKTKLNCGNLIQAINTYAVSLIRYSAAFISWRKDEIQNLDRRTRKPMTMYKALHPKMQCRQVVPPYEIRRERAIECREYGCPSNCES